VAKPSVEKDKSKDNLDPKQGNGAENSERIFEIIELRWQWERR